MDYNEYEDDFDVVNEVDNVSGKNNSSDKNKKSFSFLKKIPAKLIIFLSIFIVIAIFLTIFFTHDYFKKYRTNFITNIKIIDSRFGFSEKFNELFSSDEDGVIKMREEQKAAGTTYDNETYLIPFENACNSAYKITDGGVIVAKSNFIGKFNKKGEIEWSLNTNVVNPILDVDGRYILLSENGGTKVCLYENNKFIYETDAQNTILNASVSSVGDVAVVTDKEFFKGAVEVFNKIGERVFSWGSGTNTVVSADVSPSGRRIAVAFLDTKKEINGSVQFFNIDESENYKKVEIPGTAIFDLEFIGETLNVFGDNRFIGLSVHGGVKWDVSIDGELTAFSVDKAGNKAIVVDNNNVPFIITMNKDGKTKSEIRGDELSDFVDIQDKYVLYNNTRMILFGKAKNPEKYAATMDVKGLKIIDKNCYIIIYNNSLEFVHV